MLQIDILTGIALTACFCILLTKKIGLIDKIVETSKSKLIAELFSCDFCLSFWTSLIVSIVIAFIFNDITYLSYAILAAPATRFLL